MEVGLAAAKAIEKVHGMKYEVGTGPKILCKYQLKPFFFKFKVHSKALDFCFSCS